MYKIENFKIKDKSKICIKNIVLGGTDAKNITDDRIDVQGACFDKPNKLTSPIKKGSHFDFEYYIANDNNKTSVNVFSSYNCTVIDDATAECMCLSSVGKTKQSNRVNPMACNPGYSYEAHYDYIWNEGNNTGEFSVILEDGLGISGQLKYTNTGENGDYSCTNSLRIDESYCRAIFGNTDYDDVYCSSNNIEIDENPLPNCKKNKKKLDTNK